jgi:hypothetical protein
MILNSKLGAAKDLCMPEMLQIIEKTTKRKQTKIGGVINRNKTT